MLWKSFSNEVTSKNVPPAAHLLGERQDNCPLAYQAKILEEGHRCHEESCRDHSDRLHPLLALCLQRTPKIYQATTKQKSAWCLGSISCRIEVLTTTSASTSSISTDRHKKQDATSTVQQMACMEEAAPSEPPVAPAASALQPSGQLPWEPA